jgi:hypothetical protein
MRARTGREDFSVLEEIVHRGVMLELLEASNGKKRGSRIVEPGDETT